MSKLEFSREIELRKIPQNGHSIHERATADELVALAKRYKLEAVVSFSVEAEISAWRKKGIEATGSVKALVRQNCVVTLDAFEQVIEETFNTLFLPAHMIKESEDPEEDLPEALNEGIANIGELAVQVLALGIDPHPRKPEAKFHYQESDEDDQQDQADNPFLALKGLHDKGSETK